jgi:CxxC motif-containing protein (DUF1111 family)
MPHPRLRLPTFRTHRNTFTLASPGGRVFGLVLAMLGIVLVASAAAPLLAGAQSTERGSAVRDPGVRGGTPGAGGVVTGASDNEKAIFADSLGVFKEVDSVSGAPIDHADGSGLGPRFNLDSCAGCHAYPDVGGSSPPVNPQIAAAARGHPTTNDPDAQVIPSFIKIDGPVREARFKTNSDGSPDGGVHDLFTIRGRSDAQGCKITQPDFAGAVTANNVIFRIPTPVFGDGLIESIPDQTILDNKTESSHQKSALGISGRENREDNTGTITRFGWKAQDKSLQLFAGEAYNVEQGVSNQIFPDEREASEGCVFNPTPEDHSSFHVAGDHLESVPDDTVQFRLFMRLLAPPTPESPSSGTQAATILNGKNQFNAVGCALCHTPTLHTVKQVSTSDSTGEVSAALSDKDVNLYSDLLLHDMGSGLSDGIAQGHATASEFRSAPLWGLGQRIFFLHDGRTSNLLVAIQQHASRNSEANGVVSAFNRLSDRDKQALLVFLRSL